VVGDASRMPDVNLRYCMAVTMLDGRLGYDAAHDAARMADQAVVAMGERVAFLPPPPGLDRFAAVVEVEAKETVFRAEQSRNVRGRWENPLSQREVEEKALELLCTAIPPGQARHAIDLLRKVEQLPRAADVVRALTVEG
jgi:hypothetical protein